MAIRILRGTGETGGAVSDILRSIATKERADNLLVDIHPSTGEIVFTIIEIKCRQRLSDDQRADLQEKMNEQIANTERALKFQFDPELEVINLDHELKIIELQSLLLFYLRRAARYGYLCEESFKEDEKFVLSLTKDNYSLRYKRLGLIFEFQSDELQRKEVMYADDEEITFYTMGKPMIDRILAKDAILKTTGLYSAVEAEANNELTQFFEVSERTKREALLRMNSDGEDTGNDPIDDEKYVFHTSTNVSGYKSNKAEEQQKLNDIISNESNRPVEFPSETIDSIEEPVKHGQIETRSVNTNAKVDECDNVTPIKNDYSIEPTIAKVEEPCTQYVTKAPIYDIMLGKTSMESLQYGILGKTINGNRSIAIDLSETNTISLFGVQGGGKSYSIGAVTEMTLKQFPNVNLLPAPMASVIFHYSESMDYAPEFTSMIYPNDDAGQLAKLKAQYGAEPDSLDDVIMLAPIDKVEERQEEYPSIEVLPISFHSKDLNVQDWMFLLKAVGNDSTYISQLRSIMRANRRNLNLEDLKASVESSGLLSNSQKSIPCCSYTCAPHQTL